MADLTDSLPSRPLPLSVAEQLSDRDGRFVPVSTVESDGTERVCTMLIEGAEQFRGVGYDRDVDHWEIVTEAPETGTLEGLPSARRQTLRTEVLDALERWADDRYDDPTTVVDDE
ncbi:hypothetical protein GRX03_16035 [Halovenus sp. WSH3]|uniref:DUF7964 domain-containing protein n=1 Tax=Halovenus carboxidivorans TaxID=2692199 RepID=A0A6B0T840_9EURY|nr:hypothetical protein [Halovenus carboxidivorans]MXR53107.1 hypothetical protein [Halovenus carboxidivorans]